MPSYTLAEIASLATQDVGRRADIEMSVVSLRVNMAYAEVAGAVAHASLEKIDTSSVTTGTSRVSLPADCNYAITASLIWPTTSGTSSHKTLARMSPSDLDARGTSPAGEPTSIVFFNNWMELYPSPISNYSLQLRYQSTPTDLSNLTDIPSVSTPWRYAIVLKTEEYLYRYLGNEAGAMMANAAYVNYCSHTKTDEARRQSGEMRMNFAPVYTETFGGRGLRHGSSQWSNF